MCLGFRKLLTLVVLSLGLCTAGSAAAVELTTRSLPMAEDGSTSLVLRVAADPNNLPFSNDQQQGFENRIAEIVAKDLGLRLEYVWRAQRRGFFRNTLKANKADLVLGVPAGFELARPTKPIYNSSYVFVSRADRKLDVKSLDDPRLHELKVAVQLVGDDGSNPPPAHALARRNIIQNVRGYTVYGNYSKQNPAADIMAAVAKGDVDLAIVWGPLAGFFASREAAPLEITPVTPAVDGPAHLPMVYSICAGVRRGDDALFTAVQDSLERNRDKIEQVLKQYQVPLVDSQAVPLFLGEDDDD